MKNLNYSKILAKNWEIVALVIGVTVVLALAFSLLQPFQYSASTQILIIQKQDANLDAYTATKSAERIGKNLSSIIFTSSFYNEVIESNKTIESRFSNDSVEKRKLWKNNVYTNVLPETGILEIKVYDTDREYASQLVKTITYVLVNKGAEYHGGGTDVEIKIVDDVFISKYPVRPNIVVNVGLAFIIGLILGSAFVIINQSNKDNKLANLKQIISKETVVKEPVLAAKKEEKAVATQRKVTIKTMYDHLQKA